MIFPFMSIYLSQHFSPKLVGALLMINVLIGIVSSLGGGYAADRFGRKKLIAAAEVVRCFAFTVMMICNSPLLLLPQVTVAMMVLHAMCSALVTPANQAMLIDVSEPGQRKWIFSLLYWINNLSIALGSLAGAIMFREHLFILFVFLSAVSLVNCLLIMIFIDDNYIPQAREARSVGEHMRSILESYKTVLGDRVFVLFVLSTAMILSMEFQLSHYIGMRLAEEMPVQNFLWWSIGGVEMTGILKSENTILVVALALFASRMTSKRNGKFMLWISGGIFVLSYGVISYTNQVWVLAGMMLTASLAEVIKVPIEQSWLAALPPEQSRSSYLAVSSLKHNMTLLLCSVTVFVSSYLSSLGTTLVITFIGVSGVVILVGITSALEQRMGICTSFHAKERKPAVENML